MPVDRLLVAQTLSETRCLVTHDGRVARCGEVLFFVRSGSASIPRVAVRSAAMRPSREAWGVAYGGHAGRP